MSGCVSVANKHDTERVRGNFKGGKREEDSKAPVDHGLAHGGGDGHGGGVVQAEDALDNAQLGARRIHATERAPVVGDQAGTQHVATTVDRTRLESTSWRETKVNNEVECRQAQESEPYHEGHLQQRRQFVLLADGGAGMHLPSAQTKSGGKSQAKGLVREACGRGVPSRLGL